MAALANLRTLFIAFIWIPCALGLSQSKLSVHTGPSITGTTTTFVSSGQPRIVKLLDSFDIAVKLKQLSPGIIVIGRIYLQEQPMDGDPVARAEEWWAQVNTTLLAYRAVDYWEGYNEPNADAAAMPWYNAFEVHRVALMAKAGLRAVIGCFSVGMPDVTVPSTIQAFYPAIDTAMANGGILGLHEYCQPFMACGRYRKLYRQYLIPTRRVIPLAITELGIDSGSVRKHLDAHPGANGGWRDFMSAAEYVSQLQWYDSLLRADNYTLGATIFLMDDSYGWDSFLVDGECATRLAAYLHP